MPLLGARDASAYCRTTTTKLPGASYDPSNLGTCWTQGTPLAWPSGKVTYSLSSAASTQPGVGLAEATRVAELSFATWNGAKCPKGPLRVEVVSTPPTDPSVVASDCGLNPCDPSVHDPLHLIVFRDTGWMHGDGTNTLALTTVTYGTQTGTIFDADIEINSSTSSDPPHYLIATEPPPDPLPANTYDLQSILTHEAGHFYGLAHATAFTSVMYAFYSPGSIALTSDDLDGICAIYSPDPSGCGCQASPAHPGTLALSAAASLAALFAWRRKRR